MARYMKFEDVLDALNETRCSDCSCEKPLDCSLCQIGDVHMHILGKTVYLDVVPKAIVNQIFEDIFLCCKHYENGNLVAYYDDILEIENKFQRQLNL